ncbi:MAG: NUDIX hydrolase [Candidatus Bilamarchaeum sp.]|jgi:16S rRNA (adenine1518-N6/adenine1519-N6)-dimethyltransferase
MVGSDLVDIIDEKDVFLFATTRKEMRSKNLLHRVCHFFVFNPHGDIFITKRSLKKDYAPGKWEIGQGGVLSKDESYESGTIRELYEELGIKDKPNFLFMTRFLGINTRFICAIYRIITKNSPWFNDGEISEGKFVSPSTLNVMINQDPKQFSDDSLALYLEFWTKINETNCVSGAV